MFMTAEERRERTLYSKRKWTAKPDIRPKIIKAATTWMYEHPYTCDICHVTVINKWSHLKGKKHNKKKFESLLDDKTV
jgi:hypothetical protein